MHILYRSLFLVGCLLASLFFFGFVPKGTIKNILPVNTAEKGGVLPSTEQSEFDEPVLQEAPKVLVFHALSYDSMYSHTIGKLLYESFPSADVTHFYKGNAESLRLQLADRQVVVIVYPSTRLNTGQVAEYGRVLNRFVETGGTAMITGTHDAAVLRHLNLLNLQATYFCPEPQVHELNYNEGLTEGTPMDFELVSYAYPVQVNDPMYVSVAGIRNRNVYAYRHEMSVDTISTEQPNAALSVLGYCPKGRGRVFYLGFEYYFDESASSRILANALRQAVSANEQEFGFSADRQLDNRQMQSVSEFLYAGSGRSRMELLLFPNPYVTKATLELKLEESAQLSVEMVDERGVTAAVLLPSRSVQSGTYRFELPDLEPGIYYVKCSRDGRIETRKVVKTSSL